MWGERGSNCGKRGESLIGENNHRIKNTWFY